jgi:hypothetical protein
MPTEPRQVPVGPQPDAAARRLHIHGIKEMPAGYDAEVAELFRDLRSATALTEMDLATRLGTRPDVVQALEQGALYALPPWAETCRVVNAYGALLNLDVRPLLRRIYAQLEAGIVELQPKAMPDMPVMTPQENGDFGYASGNSSAAARPNPLDIPWPPPDMPQRQQPQHPPQQPWQNAGAQPHAAPQAPRPNAGYQPHPQNAWPQAQPGQPHPQGRPAAQPQPQAPRPGAPQAGRPAMPQPGADRRPPQARPAQGQPPQPQPAPSRPAPPQPQFQPQPQPQFQPEPMPVDADFGVPEAALPEPKPKRRRPPLLKWALGLLILAVVAFGLWFALSHAPGTSGLQSPGSGTSDPDDPRSRKADRLPDASQPAPPAQ